MNPVQIQNEIKKEKPSISTKKSCCNVLLEEKHLPTCLEWIERYHRHIFPAYYNCQFENYVVTDNNRDGYDKAKEFLINEKGLFLFGQPGTGKSHLAGAINRELFWNDEYDIRFLSVPEIINQARINGIFHPQDFNTKFLILDDFGAEKMTEFAIETIYLLIDFRYRQELNKTVITSNLSLGKIGELMDDRISSRIAGTYKYVELKESDWRLK